MDVWQVLVSPESDDAGRLIAATTDEEREQAARLRTPGHGDRWLAARGALRRALGERLDLAPAALTFAAGPHGKPELAGVPVRFNLSHAGDVALIALADVEVGVDVERLAGASRAVERALTHGERAGLTADDRHAQLLRVWCRKEARAKAIGTGLGWAPERFDTSAPEGYWLTDVPVATGYVAALAVAGGEARVDIRSLTKLRP